MTARSTLVHDLLHKVDTLVDGLGGESLKVESPTHVVVTVLAHRLARKVHDLGQRAAQVESHDVDVLQLQ